LRHRDYPGFRRRLPPSLRQDIRHPKLVVRAVGTIKIDAAV
jgi:hypothetical protein